ncbi:MAG TPA: MlaD family protein [Solirubrobacteraceae bacterium]|jgi:phospholipid/cholesterol/gamma-HCH transport system substrate-binding protein|nr:MlaD family protein [Solirubrobacteraceae bacterium]
MATTTPPSPPPTHGPPPSPPPRGPAVRAPGPNTAARWVAGGALALVVLVVAYILFAGGGGASYQLLFANASQLVRGDEVQVGGVSVGSVTDITLTRNYKARVTIHVEGSLVPLHEGTTAQVRVPSLTTVAGRYVALVPGPNNRPALAAGATLPASAAQGTVDLDQLFDIFNPRTLKGLQNLFVGTAESYAGVAQAAGESAEYFGPALASATRIFAELNRDQPVFTNFLVKTAQALSTIGAHREQLTGLIGHGDETFQALAAEQSSLQRGVHELPATLQQGNRAFAELPATFAALHALVDVAKPDTTKLASFFARLAPLLDAAQPVLHNLSLAIGRPGPANDLTDAALGLPAFAHAVETSVPSAVTGLQESVPVTAFFGPYAPDLAGAARDFGTDAGYYDANGHYARAALVVDNFKLSGNTLKPTTPQEGIQGAHLRELRRCPGAGATPPPADGSAPFTDSGLLGCDPAEVP